ncbi:MAG TPA: acetolactate synthase small subunit [Blastocatellia bacterium]|nr:acetolactate synthase small subunit [Blastocatellia bacterium]
MRHTLSILVENRFGELSRIVGLFSARGYNVESLTVAETLDPKIARVTLVTTGSDQTIEQITGQLNKQVRVLEAVDMTGFKHIEREMALINVTAGMGPARQEVLSLAGIFRAKVVDVSRDGIIIEATGDWAKVSALIELLKPLGIRDIVRTGAVAIARLSEQTEGETADGEINEEELAV